VLLRERDGAKNFIYRLRPPNVACQDCSPIVSNYRRRFSTRENNTGRLMLLFEVSASQPQLPCETWFILAYTVLAASNSSEWCIAIPLTFFSFPYSHVNKISAPESSQSISCKLRRVDVWFVEFPCANYCCSLSCWSSRITR